MSSPGRSVVASREEYKRKTLISKSAEKAEPFSIRLLEAFTVLLCLTIMSACESDTSANLAGSERSPVTEIMSLDQFNRVVESAGERLLVFEFYADWCLPCKELKPIMEKIARDNSDTTDFFKVDLEALRSVGDIFKVRGIPYVAFVKNGTIVFSLIGLHPKSEYEKAIKSFSN